MGFAAADACRLPFKDGVFDSIYCVAVLQHIDEVDTAVREFARVTAPRGRVLAVEPDNSARYGFSSTPMGRRAFELSAQFFIALAGARGDRSADRSRTFPSMFARHGIEPLSVRLFPVSETRLGSTCRFSLASTPHARWKRPSLGEVRCRSWLGREYLDVLTSYEREANAAGASFVEIQNTMLFATVGQKA